ncbi:MAG: AMP-binding protein, partial [Deltaproteobacteria bacterium]|nr:AMP-binding protein [Deltaproteobacteria bacterium]
MNVGKVLSETARRMPQKTAVIFKDEKIDFAALDLRATRLANKLQGSDVKKGDRVAIILPNSSQFVVAYFAVMKMGAIAVPLDFRFKGEELFPILTDARIKAVITTSLYQSCDVFSRVESITTTIMAGEDVADEIVRYEEVMSDESLSSEITVDIKEEEDALYLYT